MALRPEREVPQIKGASASTWNAEVAHEESIQAYMAKSDLAILTDEQIAVMSLIAGYGTLGLDLPATREFLQNIHDYSSGKEGIARIQCKEIITAGAFPMNLLHKQEEGGALAWLKSLIGGKKSQQQQGTQ